MSSPATTSTSIPELPPARFLGAMLSFLVPGLGQIVQGMMGGGSGRFAKGVVFMVCLLGMFFLGMYLGEGKNVYLPQFAQMRAAAGRPVTILGRPLTGLAGNLYTRLQYIGQFWIGAAAWPALVHYYAPDNTLFGDYQRVPARSLELRDGRTLGEVEEDVKGRFGEDPAVLSQELQRLRWSALEDAEDALNQIQLDPEMGKRWDIAWVYTVIAGILNILVIYDAWAGPAHRVMPPANQLSESVKGAA